MKPQHVGETASEIEEKWRSKRWEGIVRKYTAEDVLRLRGTWPVRYITAEKASEKLWYMLHTTPYVFALGAVTGSQAVQMVEAGFKAIYVSGWQVAADMNVAGQTYPDLGLYPYNSVPLLVKRIVQALQRADQIQTLERKGRVDYFAPIIADGEAGFGGPLHAFELMKSMIEAGAAAVHLEDQSPGERRCGHLGSKVLVPTRRFISILSSARLAADVLGVPSIIIARTDAIGASHITGDGDPVDSKYIRGGKTSDGYYRIEAGLDMAIDRGLAYALYAELIWFETSKPSLEEAKRYAEAIHSKYPQKLLAYNLSPSFNWAKTVDSDTLVDFQRKLASYGYKYQFITLAGFHSLNTHIFQLARDLAERGMPAYAQLQRVEIELEKHGYRAFKHQS
ncbi:MAG: isocitrate lyase, partial [Nitrososphaerota archaeon]